MRPSDSELCLVMKGMRTVKLFAPSNPILHVFQSQVSPRISFSFDLPIVAWRNLYNSVHSLIWFHIR
jgi:hypothetical protein